MLRLLLGDQTCIYLFIKNNIYRYTSYSKGLLTYLYYKGTKSDNNYLKIIIYFGIEIDKTYLEKPNQTKLWSAQSELCRLCRLLRIVALLTMRCK